MYRRFISAASVVALATTGVPVAAQSPSQSQNLTVTVCAGPNGQLRIVGTSEACRNSETRLTWDARGGAGEPGPAGPQGPAGPAGPQGEVGPAGPQGEAGPAGADGAQGPVGPVGPMGPQGPAGADGAQGAVGPQGPAGPQGEQGATGATGPQGETGPMGPQGETGPAGPQGVQGERGADGAQGLTGPQGPAGVAGAAGAALLVEWSWGTAFNLTGRMIWTAIPDSIVSFTSEGGPLLINLDMSLRAQNSSQKAGCRPMIDGVWAGTFGGYPFSETWTEGTNFTNGWTLWAKSRVYRGIPAGPHTLTIECAKDSDINITVGQSDVPQSLSVLELH